MSSNHLILCFRLLLLPSIFPNIRIFSNGSVLCVRWPEYWSFIFSISPSNEYSGLVSFRMNFKTQYSKKEDHGIWPHHCRLDLPAVQGTLKSLLQQFSFMLPWKEKLISHVKCASLYLRHHLKAQKDILLTNDRELGVRSLYKKPCYFINLPPDKQTLFRFFINWTPKT